MIGRHSFASALTDAAVEAELLYGGLLSARGGGVERARAAYLADAIDVEELERLVESALLAEGSVVRRDPALDAAMLSASRSRP